MSYETGTATHFLDLLKKIRDYVVTKGTAFGLSYLGVGNGTITAMRGGTASVAETFVVTATSATNFTVVGSVSGAQAAATAGTPYATTLVEFTITAGATPFQAGDVFTFSTAPKWISNRTAYGPVSYIASHLNTGTTATPNLWDGIDGVGSSDNARGYGGAVVFPVTIEAEFMEAETIAEYTLESATGSGENAQAPRDWTLEYWDGGSWVTLHTAAAQTAWVQNERRTYTIPSPVSATRYRLNVTASNSGANLRIKEWKLRRTAGGFNALFSQVLLQAPGNDGNSAFYYGMHAFFRLDSDYYNILPSIFDGHVASDDYLQQPGISNTGIFMPCQNAPMTYWIFANGRHLKVVVKIGSQYENMYIGAYDPFLPPNQLPYPVCVGASLHMDSTTDVAGYPWHSTATVSWASPLVFKYDVAGSHHSSFTHSDTGSTSDSTPHKNNCNLAFRHFDGTYRAIYTSKGKSTYYINTIESAVAVLWPVCVRPNLMDPNLDGGYTIYPLQILARVTPQQNAMGQLDGCGWVTGQGIGAESTIDDGPRRWIVFPDFNRNTRDAYWCAEAY